MGWSKIHRIYCFKLNNCNYVNGWRYSSLFIVHLVIWASILNGINCDTICEPKVLEELPPDPVSGIVYI